MIVVTPLGVEKIHPPTETTSFTDSPEILSGVKLVKVVADVVCTVILTGTNAGNPSGVGAGGTKQTGNVLSVKLIALALIAATEPVTWLGSSIILFVVRVIAAGPRKGIDMSVPLPMATDPWTTTDTC